MSGWICKRCETGNDAGLMTCEVCDSPLLYTHEEFEWVVTQRVNEVRKEVMAAAKAAAKPATTTIPKPASTEKPVPVPAPAGDSCAIWFLVFLLAIVLAAVLYVAVFEPALWSEIRIEILRVYNDLLLKLQ